MHRQFLDPSTLPKLKIQSIWKMQKYYIQYRGE